MRIRECQEELMRIADEAPPDYAARIRKVVLELYRRPGHRTDVKSDPMSPAKVRDIRRLKRVMPELSQKEISIIHNVNPGRVSESLYGKRP